MMAGREKAPVRTEADVSAALTELAQRAPSAGAVLSAVCDAGAHQQDPLPRTPGARRRPGTRRLAPRLRWPQLAVAATAAAAIALAVVLTPGSAPVRAHGPSQFPSLGALPSPPGTVSPGSVPPAVSPGRDPSTASVGKAMLAAFNATAGYLVFQTSDDFTKGHQAGTSRSWNWPAVPTPGRLEYTRRSYNYHAVAGVKGTGKLTEDVGYTTVVPPPSRYGQNADARVIVVCHAGDRLRLWPSRRAGRDLVDAHRRAGVLRLHTEPCGAGLARQIAHGEWRILGHSRLRGQRAIKLAETPAGNFKPLPVFLWVSTVTYLPLRMVWLSGSKSGEIDNWYYLPPTKANLAQLRVPVPAGYHRSG